MVASRKQYRIYNAIDKEYGIGAAGPVFVSVKRNGA